jgi:hypothetical protein
MKRSALRRLLCVLGGMSIGVLVLPQLSAPSAAAASPPPSVIASWNSNGDFLSVRWNLGGYATGFIADTTSSPSTPVPAGTTGVETSQTGTTYESVATAGVRTVEMAVGNWGPGWTWEAGPTVTVQVPIYLATSQVGSSGTVNVSWYLGGYATGFLGDTTSGTPVALPAGSSGAQTSQTGSLQETGEPVGENGLRSYEIVLGNWGPGWTWEQAPAPNPYTSTILLQPAGGNASAAWGFEPYNSSSAGGQTFAGTALNQPSPASPGGPNNVVFDAYGNAWSENEFSNGVTEYPSNNQTPQVFTVPDTPTQQPQCGTPAIACPFFQNAYGHSQSNRSDNGEQVIDGPSGTIWFTEGGDSVPAGDTGTNQARIIGVAPSSPGASGSNPSTSQFCVYDTPNSNTQSPEDVVNGIAYDPSNDTIWFTDLSNSTVNWFTPPTSTAACGLPTGSQGSFTALQYCTVSNATDCVHSIPTVFHGGPEKMTFDPHTSSDYPDGSVWYTSAEYGSSVERVNVATSQATLYALPQSHELTAHPGVGIAAGVIPWDLVTDSGPYLYVAESFDGDLVQINKDTGAMSDVEVPWDTKASGDQCTTSTTGLPFVPFLALDSAANRLYFDTDFCDPASGTAPADSALGYISITPTSNWSSTSPTGYILTRLPSIGCSSSCGSGAYGGVAVNPSNHRVVTVDGQSPQTPNGGGLIELSPSS